MAASFSHPCRLELVDLVPGILNQLGPDSIENLRQIAASIAGNKASSADDEDIPDLVKDFESASTEATA